MAFSENDRVYVTSVVSPYRNLYGTVITSAATAGDGYNRVRIDGFQKDQVVLLTDEQMRSTSLPANVDYSQQA